MPVPEATAQDDLALLERWAREAGEVACRFWRQAPETWHKPEGAGPVTEADLAVDALLRRELMAARPAYGWLSEETEDDPARLSARRVFVVDPIDGTRAFVEGAPDWALSLAVVEDGRPLAGVVWLPARDKLYAATRGGGARLGGKPIHVSPRETLEGARVLTGRAALAAEHWVDEEPPELERRFRSSLAYRLCLVAEGRFDAMLMLRPTWEWDIAAGALMVTEAGGRATDRHGEELTFNTPRAQADGIVAAGPALQPALLARLAPAPKRA